MTELENILLFFTQRRRRVISISSLAKEAGINRITLSKFLNREYARYLTSEQVDKLVPILADFGYKPVKSEEQFI